MSPNSNIITVSEDPEEIERSVYLAVSKNNEIIYHDYVGANLLKDRLAFFAELDDCPLEKLDVNCLIDPATQIIYVTKDTQLATAFLLSLFELPYEEIRTLYNKFNLDGNSLRTTDLSFSFIVHY